MRTLQKYRDIDVTPMAYYRFLTKFALIFGLIFNVYNTVNMILTNPYWVDILYCVSVVVLNLLSLIWLREMKWKGIMTLCGLYLLSIIFNFTIFVLCVNAGTDFSGSVSRTIAQLLIAIPTWNYFDKRRFLFSPVPPWGSEGEASSESTAKSIEEGSNSEKRWKSNERPIVYRGIYGKYVQHPIEFPKLRKREEVAEPKELVFSLETNFRVKPAAESKRQNQIKIIAIILSALLVVSVGLNIWSMRHVALLGNQLADSSSKIEALAWRLKDSLLKVDELNSQLRIKQTQLTDLANENTVLNGNNNFSDISPDIKKHTFNIPNGH